MDETKKKALDAAIAKIEKSFGAGSIMRLSDSAHLQVDVIPSGCMSIDIASGIGGVPRGRVVEIYGPESSGKTTVALHIIAEAQKMGGVAAFIDAEHALDPVYAQKLGVDLPSLFVSQPDNGEQAVDIVEQLVATAAFDIIVVDSVAALTPKAEIEGEMSDSFMGLHARLMSKALRKLTSVISKTNTCVIFINQLREKIGVVYGNPEVTTGGKALKFYASIRMDIRRGEPIKDGAQVVGYKTKCKFVKNKLAPPFRVAEFEMTFGHGINQEGDILDFAIKSDIVKKSGSWFSYNDERIGQGKDAVKKFMTDNPAVRDEIKARVLEEYKKGTIVPTIGETPAADE